MRLFYRKKNENLFLAVDELKTENKTPLISFKLVDGKYVDIEHGFIPTENIENDVEEMQISQDFVESFLLAEIERTYKIIVK